MTTALARSLQGKVPVQNECGAFWQAHEAADGKAFQHVQRKFNAATVMYTLLCSDSHKLHKLRESLYASDTSHWYLYEVEMVQKLKQWTKVGVHCLPSVTAGVACAPASPLLPMPLHFDIHSGLRQLTIQARKL